MRSPSTATASATLPRASAVNTLPPNSTRLTARCAETPPPETAAPRGTPAAMHNADARRKTTKNRKRIVTFNVLPEMTERRIYITKRPRFVEAVGSGQ
jgi:hypothetical protein